MGMARLTQPRYLADVADYVVIPAYILHELTVAFKIGIILYIPFIVIDMGTATTLCVVDAKKNYIGGMILPGVGISLDALTARASQLSGIAIEAPKHIIGKNTVDCMKSGVLYSSAGAIDGCIDRIEEELGEKTTVIATGGLAKKIIPHCRRQIILDDELLLKGLYVIYMKNRSVMC
jgi:type III pantothenate kinase